MYDERTFHEIYHLSDLHIRNIQRHEEYQTVFRRLLRKLKGKVGEKSLIVVTGDLMHSKTELSPESVVVAGGLLRDLGELAPTIVIAGNHDCSLSNSKRTDAITAVLHTPLEGVHYLRERGCYRVGNLLLGVTTVYDHTVYPASEIGEEGIKIALYHGPVHGARTDVGFRMNKTQYVVEDFAGYQHVLLGDVHKTQHLAPHVAYAGSLIQQDHGEAREGHGYLHWNLETGETTHCPISNDYGFCTVECDSKGKIPKLDWPRKTRLRLVTDAMTEKAYDKACRRVREKTEVVELTRIEKTVAVAMEEEKIGQDWEAHAENLRSYLETLGFAKSRVEGILGLHSELYEQLSGGLGETHSPAWSLEEMSWSNMLCYGSDNSIDLRTVPGGILGLVAPNQWGKSAVLDILIFCLYDKFGRGDKRSIMNYSCREMSCSVLIRMGSVRWRIVRKGVRAGESVRVTVHLHRILRDCGEEAEEDCSGDNRVETNAKIVELLGDLSDYLTTNLSLQRGKSHDLIDMTQAARKEYLHRALKLDFLQAYHVEAKKRLKDATVASEVASKLAHRHDVSTAAEDLEECRQAFQAVEKKHQQLEFLESLTPISIPPCPQPPPALRSYGLTTVAECLVLESELAERIATTGTQWREELDRVQSEMDTVCQTLQSLPDVGQIGEEPSTTHEEAQEHLHSLPIREKPSRPEAPATVRNPQDRIYEYLQYGRWTEVDHLDVRREERENFSQFLDTLPSSPSIAEWQSQHRRWMKETGEMPPHILDGETCIEETVRYTEYFWQDTLYRWQLAQWERDTVLYEKYLECRKVLQYWEDRQTVEERDCLHTRLGELRARVRELQSMDTAKSSRDLELIRGYRLALWNWEQTSLSTQTFRENWEKVQSESVAAARKYDRLQDRLKRAEGVLTSALQYAAEAEEKSNLASLWNDYVKVTHFSGLPLSRLEKGLPHLASHVNTVLRNLVDYTVSVELEKGSVAIYIVHTSGEKYPATLSCGLEAFTISLAFRVALRNLPGVPRPDFIVIDEGWSCLDRGKLASVGSLLQYLVSQYKYVWIISHLEELQAEMNTQMAIQREDESSRLVVP